MIIWLASYPRSGNTFFRILINSVFHLKTYSVYDDKGDIAADQKTAEVVGHQSFPEGFDLQRARESDELYLIKTHELPDPELADPVIYLLRDGRESTLSYRKYLNEFYAAQVDLLDVIRGNVFAGSWGGHVRAWAPTVREQTLLIRFEDLIANPLQHVEAIAQFIGKLPVAKKIPSFEELKSINTKFFRRGRTDSWKEEISRLEHHVFWLRHYREMIEYGYTDAMPELFRTPEQVESLTRLVDSEREYTERKLRVALADAAKFKPSESAIPAAVAESADNSSAFIEAESDVAAEQAQEGVDPEVSVDESVVFSDAENISASSEVNSERASSETSASQDPEDDASLVHTADTLNAEGEALYLRGEIESAKGKFEAALALEPGYATSYNNLMVLCWDSGDIENAVLTLERGLEQAPNDRDLLLNGANLLRALAQQEAADVLAGRALEVVAAEGAAACADPGQSGSEYGERETGEPVHVTPVAEAISPQGMDTHKPAGTLADSLIEACVASPCGEIVIATSIAPKGIEKQQRAVASWLRLGFKVASLNTETEIAEIKTHFPQVEFVAVTRDGKALAGKPYVFIDDVLDYLAAQSGSAVCGIVNSDIILRADSALHAYLCREALGSMVYGSRVDIRSAEDGDGDWYHRGFDFFFFGRETIPKLPRTDFMLGVPWWDYWVPVGYQLAGVPIKRLDSRIAFHVWHETNYSQEALVKFGDKFVEYCGQAPFVHMFQQCLVGDYGQACYSVLSDAALDYIARTTAKHVLGLEPGVAATANPAANAAPKVTAIVTAYASAEFIGGCLDDLVNQTIADQLEIVVIDAASPQDEKGIVADFQQRYPAIPIVYHRTEQRIGTYTAWNLGVRLATGQYLIPCRADERLRVDACEILARTLDDNPGVALVYGNSIRTENADAPFDAAALCGLLMWPEYRYEDLRNHPLVGPHPMWRRSVHNMAGYFDESFAILGDQEFWLRIGKEYRLKSIHDFTGLYRVWESALTDAGDRAKQENERLRLQCHHLGYYMPSVLAADAEDAVVRSVTRGKELPREAALEGDITIATSIAPKGIEKQQLAVSSWKWLGFKVASLNTASEIAELKGYFPGVEFVEVKRNGKLLAGKPYVFLDDVLDYLHERSATRIGGIVNSDIILKADGGFREYLQREVPGSLVYGPRVDVRAAYDADGELYHRGFDFFFFDRDVIRRLPKTDFMLGVPWWDYWVPVGSHLAGIPVKRLDSRIAFHIWHVTNYSQEVLIKFAHDFADYCKEASFVHLYTQCLDEKYGPACYSVLSDAALDYIARNTAKHLLPASTAGGQESAPATLPGPKVSAIVSTYMSAAFIGECLDDLVHQTISDQIEIVVIDAASPEDEGSVVSEYQARYPHVSIRYHRTPERIGVYAAWNLAAKLARGDYLISCSTNDRLRLDACEILARTLDENPDVTLVYGNSFLTKVPHECFDAATLSSLYIWPEYRYEDLLTRCMVGPHPMWRRGVHDAVGYFDESYVAMGDQEFWLRIGKSHKLKSIPDFTGLYFVSESSLTGNADVVARETNRLRTQVQMHDCYMKWRELETKRRIDRALDTTGYPALHVVIMAPPGQLGLVEHTLNDLGMQNYENLQVTILADQVLPESAAIECEGLRWMTYRSVMDIPRLVHQAASTVEAEWVCLVEAGDRLEASTFQDVGGYMLRNPAWQLIYTDEDRLDGQGQYAEPRFKPDFNLSLLRVNPYIGNLVFVRTAVCRELRGLSTMALWRASDLALRVADHYSAASVGHIASVLLHRRPANDTAWGVGAEVHEYKQAIEKHLQRRGLAQAGKAPPKLSIVFVSLGNASERMTMVRNLIAKTEYPDYEILLIEPSGAESIVPLVDAQHLDRVRKVETSGMSPGGALNAAARSALGEFLVFLDGRCMALQADWLHRLLMPTLEQDVGIVSARLVTKNKTLIDGGVVLGLGTRCVGARMNVGVHMQESGYMERAQSAQDMSAVTSLCMLVRSDVYANVGGFDGDLTTGLYRDVDFCLRAQDKGWRIVWTPAATLMYLGDENGADRPPRKLEILDAENEYMLNTWFKRLVNDPMFNRNLSHLHQNYQMELNTVPTWDAEIDAEPRILGFGVGSYGSWQYRGAQPLEALNDSGLARCTQVPFSGKTSVTLPTPVDIERMRPHTLLMHNTLHDDYLKALENYKRRNDVHVIFGQDDLMFAIPPKNPFSKTVYKDIKKRIRKCIALSDQVLVTTAPLADAMREFTDNVLVLPNYLRGTVWGDLTSMRRQGDKPRVGWAGAQQHGGDLELLIDVVKATAEEVEWVFFGMCPEALRPFVREIHTAVPFEDYPSKLAGLNLDLAVAPLERNRFNEAKSNLRVLEYGVLGWPVIASDIHPYQQGPICRVPNNPSAWIKAIRERINDLDALAHEGDLLREWVKSGWMLEDHLDDWLAVLAPGVRTAVAIESCQQERITA